jgi:molybdopterin/thiamine biosynthesis adenylyltransferase
MEAIISRKNCQTKNLPDSDPDLTSSSLVTFGPKFDCILLHIQNFTRRRMLNVKSYKPPWEIYISNNYI